MKLTVEENIAYPDQTLWQLIKNSTIHIRPFTGYFLLASFFSFSLFFIFGKSLIWADDGIAQHIKAFAYYGMLLRSTISGIASGSQTIIPEYSMGLGYGGDILGTLHYYVAGEPLNLFAALVPVSYAWILYSFLIVIRLYLAGLAFCIHCSYLGKGNNRIVPIVAIYYVFCGFALYAGVRHPFFLIPLITAPLILTGIERCIRENKIGLFAASIFLAGISNFYFFYHQIILSIIYTIISLVASRRKDKGYPFIRKGLLLLIGGIIGVLLAAIILVPAISFFVISSRSASSSRIPLLYEPLHYLNLLASFAVLAPTSGIKNWAVLGFGTPGLIIISTLFTHKNRIVPIFFVILFTLFLLFPLFGSLLNGFSYPVNRWLWAFPLLLAICLYTLWPENVQEESYFISRTKIPATIYLIVATVCSLIMGISPTGLVILALSLFCCIVLASCLNNKNKRGNSRHYSVLPAIILSSIAINAYCLQAPTQGNYVDAFIPIEDTSLYYGGIEENLTTNNSSSPFARYSEQNRSWNVSLLAGASSTQGYWSMVYKGTADFFKDQGINVSYPQKYSGLDKRTILQELANTSFFIAPSTTTVPFGYQASINPLYSDTDGTAYINSCELPFGYTYSSQLSSNAYANASLEQRQGLLLSSVLLEQGKKHLPTVTQDLEQEDIVFAALPTTSDITINNNCVTTTATKASCTLKLRGSQESETYFVIKGLDYIPSLAVDLYGDSTAIDPNNTYSKEDFFALTPGQQLSILREKLSKPRDYIPISFTFNYLDGSCETIELPFNTKDSVWYSGYHDFVINSGYSESSAISIDIKFPYPGQYRFDEIKVVCQTFDNYKEKISALSENHLENVNMHYLGETAATNYITGDITLNTEKVLLISIPYSDGWTAYIDGKEAVIERANIMFMGLVLSPGTHTIELCYETPGLRLGALLSLAGLTLFIAVQLLERRRIRDNS